MVSKPPLNSLRKEGEAVTSADLEARLTELEGRYAFLDDLVNQLDEVISRQQRSIEELRLQLQHTRDLLARGQAHDAGPMDERPPHY